MEALRIGISTCPNDTFIYEALANGALATPVPLQFVYHDVQTLNEMVRAGEIDIAKISCGVLPEVLGQYALLRSGGAMGYGCGPLLLSSVDGQFRADAETWLPGRDTTAALLFRHWCENAGVASALPALRYGMFDALYRSLRTGEARQGVVIHEHRFTWQRDGLHLLADLGEFWERSLGAPIPLGCAVVRRSLGEEMRSALESVVADSLRWAWAREAPITPYIREMAQIADDEVILAHIRTFVTPYSLDLGDEGIRALQTLFRVWERATGREPSAGQLFPPGATFSR